MCFPKKGKLPFVPHKRKLAKSNKLNKAVVYSMYSEFVNSRWNYKFDAGRWIKSLVKFPKLKRMRVSTVDKNTIDKYRNGIFELFSPAGIYYCDARYNDSKFSRSKTEVEAKSSDSELMQLLVNDTFPIRLIDYSKSDLTNDI